ncbi:MAG: GNAT family N-acetyltransferase [Pseudomonadota bacterium]|uniref:GNAT family N-acetyltransferase n=1 Tax=Lysobacter sp. N42 TaxID=2545719 RepID=UPI001049C493|nr:GNAT family N-acetyltransferase [Lysobacter sp. N42]TCZ83981.1 GNAT family N-acetyltransferase [Lysobacter sp. N42]
MVGETIEGVRVRDARIGDAADVATLLDLLGYPCSRAEAADRIAMVLADPRQRLLIAEIGGHACALAGMDLRYSLVRGTEQARITALVVAPDCERQGVGRRLLREVEAIARQAGAARIEVTSAASREGAPAFYHGCGFTDGARHFVKLLGD